MFLVVYSNFSNKNSPRKFTKNYPKCKTLPISILLAMLYHSIGYNRSFNIKFFFYEDELNK